MIRELGSFQPMCPEGYLLNVSSRERITFPWSQAVDAIRDAYLEHIPQADLYGIYIRGSVARGEAVFGQADIDTFAVTTESPVESDFEWGKQVREQLRLRFPFATRVELAMVARDVLLHARRAEQSRFQVKTQSVCIHGQDVAPLLARFRPGRGTVFYAPRFTRRLKRFRRAITRDELPEQQRAIARWITKFMIRTGFDLVLERVGRYTRAPWLCYSAFAEHYPAHEPLMRRTLEMMLDPPSGPERVTALVDELAPILLEEIERGELGFDPWAPPVVSPTSSAEPGPG